MEANGLLSEITVKVISMPEFLVNMKYSTKNKGVKITVRGRPSFDLQMQDVVEKYELDKMMSSILKAMNSLSA